MGIVMKSVALFLFVLLFSFSAVAKPKIELAQSTTKEVTEVRDGEKVTRFVEVDKASPGDVLQYTITYSNTGDEVAKDAVIDNPIPEGATYQGNSAEGAGAGITFSNDGGKTFAPAVKLTYEVKLPSGKTEKRNASPSQYTHIRWTVASIAPGASGKVGFQVKVD